MNAGAPERIVCLTEETTETLYLLGEERRIVGISGYTVRPPRARREKPRVSAFTSANFERIEALRPDLVIGFSDMQAEIARALIQQGFSVLVFNQRTIDGIFAMICTLSAVVGAGRRGELLVARLRENLDSIRGSAARLPRRPRVYFEEWDEPMISGIGWVSELVQLAGGEDIFRELASGAKAAERIVADPMEVVRRKPDIIAASWCGRKFRPERVRARPGWNEIPAVRDGELYEIKSAEILQPGPAALTDGVRRLHEIFTAWAFRVPGATAIA
ncbi:MAG TPA: cobalamin-binding protein [Burkholderiales bacterium]|nr:cobalamin-binding protein [Burkholderiales bacterium]